ncbi:GntR family transcriptional regulator [Roseiterribacter gracilis]|uniref:GntR family transcriptional regulator n=1 Tax=Roseiterribacter gracilis TaxID=2812848 RepID=A0A8S8X7E7_9PROT|nr:GntR family transcriptional regulator [Rhodospirillales bacterium TMPK1]
MQDVKPATKRARSATASAKGTEAEVAPPKPAQAKPAQLVERIRVDILGGRYHPGQWLKQAELESHYEASRADVRNALSLLVERGLVDHAVNQGFRISDRSNDDMREIIEMIVALETAAAPMIVARATDADIAALRAIAERFETLTRSGGEVELRLTNFDFHDALNAISGNRRLAATVRTLRECSSVRPFSRYRSFDGLQASSREHFDLLAALAARDAERLAALLRGHTSHLD